MLVLILCLHASTFEVKEKGSMKLKGVNWILNTRKGN